MWHFRRVAKDLDGKSLRRSPPMGRPRIMVSISRWFTGFPGRISITSFILLIGTGTLLLMLPVSVKTGRLGFVDALFTATSASCVTGLIVVDTAGSFSLFGQGVILLLIQVGGLGIMTLSTLFLLIAGRRPGIMERQVIQGAFTHRGATPPSTIVKEVILFACLIEGIGAVLLFSSFLVDAPPSRALYLAVFHAVSAFCNAGFCLFSDSLARYRGDWLLNLTIGALIIAGGIGFFVLSELKGHFPFSRRTWPRLSLHSKIAIPATAALVFAGTAMVLCLEWDNTLAPLALPDRLLSAFFQSVTTRTAGFNTLPVSRLSNATLFLFIMLMFIGGCPGSCAGGVKTTTVTTLMLLGFSRLRGHDQPRVFHRTIFSGSLWRAINVVMISLLVVAAATMLLLMSELGGMSHLESRGQFLELFFEVVSAFGTVGLSTGVTPGLSVPGKLLITVVMFVGRLGPLVVGIAISRQRHSRFTYAEENIMVG